MKVKYCIHRVGTPKIALPNHWTYWESEYWNNDDGWGHKSTATIFDDKDWNLPMEGEWVEFYVNETYEDRKKEDMKNYTVTAMATYFVQANSDDEASDIVYEALLGNDNHDILGCGEVSAESIIVREGTHYTIQHGENNEHRKYS